MKEPDPKRIVADGYDRMGPEFSAWNSQRPPEVRRWFLEEALARLGAGSAVLELGCGPGTDAGALSSERRYIGVDLSPGQLAIARRRVPDATFVVGDFTSMALAPESFHGVISFYAFNHVPQAEVEPTFAKIFAWLRPGGRLMTSLITTEAEDRVEEWIGVPIFFAGVRPQSYDRFLSEAGFELELSELRQEVDPLYGPAEHRWIMAKRPG
jgi:cyclopropane fatty-acyl-phospholipid synthase-like methyltransferase